MVLLCQRRTKQRKNSVAGRLCDIPSAIAYGLPHDLQGRVDDGPGALRIEVTYQLSGALKVCKQRGQRLALGAPWLRCFAHLSGLRVFGGCSLWLTSANVEPASSAEPRSLTDRRLAGGTEALNPKSALLAIGSVGRIIAATIRARSVDCWFPQIAELRPLPFKRPAVSKCSINS